MSESTGQQTNDDIFQEFKQQPYYFNLLQQLEAEMMADIVKDLECYTSNLKKLHNPIIEISKKLEEIKQHSRCSSKPFEVQSKLTMTIDDIKRKMCLYGKDVKQYRDALQRSKIDFEKVLQKQQEGVVRTKDLTRKIQARCQMSEKRIKIQNLMANLSLQIREKQIDIQDLLNEVNSLHSSSIEQAGIQRIQFKTCPRQANLRKQQQKDKQQIRLLKGVGQTQKRS